MTVNITVVKSTIFTSAGITILVYLAGQIIYEAHVKVFRELVGSEVATKEVFNLDSHWVFLFVLKVVSNRGFFFFFFFGRFFFIFLTTLLLLIKLYVILLKVVLSQKNFCCFLFFFFLFRDTYVSSIRMNFFFLI